VNLEPYRKIQEKIYGAMVISRIGSLLRGDNLGRGVSISRNWKPECCIREHGK
jgi:hypothetical protein